MEDKEIIQQIEPVRKTFFNVLKDNFQLADRTNYVHRLIYIAEHAFTDSVGMTVADFIRDSIQKVNDEYHDEFLSGALVYYPKYFCHIVEGSEDSIIKHLLLITNDEQYSKFLVKMKMLVCYHHINQRFLPAWVAVTGKPPTLLERIDVNTDITRTSRYIFNCVQKLYKLAEYQRPKLNPASSLLSDESGSVETSSSLESRMTLPDKSRTISSYLTEKYPDCLPEYGLVEFLLATPYTQSLSTYIGLYGVVQQLDAYKDKVWPVPTEFVPFHIFDLPCDPVTDLPMGTQPEVDAFKETVE